LADKKGKDRSYFAVKRGRRKRNLMIIIPIVVAVAIMVSIMAYTSGPPLPSNKMLLHIHPILTVTSNGISVPVPANIGIGQTGNSENPFLYGDHSLDQYGMQGMSPLHTHDAKGTIHVESNTVRDYTLGEFLDIWGLDVNGKTVHVTLNGNPVSDFRNLILNDGEKINLELKS